MTKLGEYNKKKSAHEKSRILFNVRIKTIFRLWKKIRIGQKNLTHSFIIFSSEKTLRQNFITAIEFALWALVL